MNVILINPPFIEIYGNYSAAAKVGAQSQQPLGICYIGGVLEKAGHKVKIIDADVEGLSVLDILDIIGKEKPDMVGTTGTTPMYNSSRMVLEKIKESFPDIITVLGGFHLTALPERTMDELRAADFGVYGEGEETIKELVKKLENKEDPYGIDGIVYFREGKVHKNPPRQLIANLEEIPFPARHLLKMELYKWSVPDKGIVSVTSMNTQRGCPFDCIFCGVKTIFPKIRYRDINNVMEEIEHVINEYGVQHIQICDDTLTLNKKKVEQFVSEVRRRKLNFSFEGYTRANTVTREMLKELKSVGLVRLSFGVETGNPKILKAIKKGVTLEEIKEAFRLTHELGIETRCSLMIGHPFETKETIKETMKFAKELKCYQAYINITTPYPGCELYEMAKKGYGGLRLLTDDWKEYRRYGNSVMEMNNLTQDELIECQRKAYKDFYMRPHIIWYNVKRAGFKAFRSVLIKSK